MFRKLSMLAIALVAVSFFTASASEAQQRRSNNRKSQVQRRGNNNRTFQSRRQVNRRATSGRSNGYLIMGRQQSKKRVGNSKYPAARTRNRGMNKAAHQTSPGGSGSISRPRPKPPRPNTTTRPSPRPRGGSTSPRPRGHGSGGTAPPDGITPGRIPGYHNK